MEQTLNRVANSCAWELAVTSRVIGVKCMIEDRGGGGALSYHGFELKKEGIFTFFVRELDMLIHSLITSVRKRQNSV